MMVTVMLSQYDRKKIALTRRCDNCWVIIADNRSSTDGW